MNCPQCRSVLPAGAQFCPSCGYRFPAQAPQPAAAYGQPAAPQAGALAYGQQPAAYPPQQPAAGYPPQYGQQPAQQPAAPPAYAPQQPAQQQQYAPPAAPAYGQPQAQPPQQPYGQPAAPAYGQPQAQPPQQPYGQPAAPAYGQQPAANPYGQPAANPYGQPAANPYGQPQPGQQVLNAIDQGANAAFGAVGNAFGQPMAMATPAGVPSIEEIIQRGYQVQIGKWMGDGWQLAKQVLWPMIGYSIILGVIANVTFGLSYLIYGPFMAGLLIVPLRTAKGRPQPFGAFFQGFRAFTPFFLLFWVSSILVGLGYLFLVLPGIYLATAFMWCGLLVLDRNMDFWPAMMASLKVVNRNFWGSFGWLLVSSFVAMGLGMVTCGIGLLFTMPWLMCMQIVAYRDIFGLNPGTDRCGG
jgi:hypothetical protein